MMARGNPRRLCLYFGLLLAASEIPAAASAQSVPLDVQVKAAFLSKFAAYVNWPPSAIGAADDPIQICVIGRDPFGQSLDEAVNHQRVDQHPILVRRMENTSEAARCHIAFLGGSAKESTVAMEQALRNEPVLTVTDAGLGTDRGMVHFELKNARVRFHIDDALAARSNLAISARLLSLAISVKARTRTS
jgi:YfiR/HmsC-like